MKNGISEGVNVTVPAAPYDVASGDGLLIGDLFGVASYDALQAAEVVIVTKGVFRMPKLSATVLAFGDPVFWTDGTPAGVVGPAGTVRIGVAVAPALVGSVTADVRLDGMVISGP